MKVVLELVDNLSRAMRRKTMQAIKSSNTSLESRVSQELWRRGLRFRKNVAGLMGKPDIAIKKYKIAIFIDSCYWHGCEAHCSFPATNSSYWKAKIERNRSRDTEVNEYYRQSGWHLLRVWEHDIKRDFDGTVGQIAAFIRSCMSSERR